MIPIKIKIIRFKFLSSLAPFITLRYKRGIFIYRIDHTVFVYDSYYILKRRIRISHRPAGVKYENNLCSLFI